MDLLYGQGVKRQLFTLFRGRVCDFDEVSSNHHVCGELLKGVMGASTLHAFKNLRLARLKLPSVTGPILVTVAIIVSV